MLWSQIHGPGANVVVPGLEGTSCDDIHSGAELFLSPATARTHV